MTSSEGGNQLGAGSGSRSIQGIGEIDSASNISSPSGNVKRRFKSAGTDYHSLGQKIEMPCHTIIIAEHDDQVRCYNALSCLGRLMCYFLPG